MVRGAYKTFSVDPVVCYTDYLVGNLRVVYSCFVLMAKKKAADDRKYSSACDQRRYERALVLGFLYVKVAVFRQRYNRYKRALFDKTFVRNLQGKFGLRIMAVDLSDLAVRSNYFELGGLDIELVKQKPEARCFGLFVLAEALGNLRSEFLI